MTFDDIKEAIIIGFILAFMIGPVFFMLIQTSILKGFRAAFFFDLGVVLGDILFLLIAYFGSRFVLMKIKDNPLLYIFGGLIMVAYGLITFFNQKQKRPIQDETLVVALKSNYRQLFFKGLFLNFINIGVLGFWLGMIVIYGAKFSMNEQKIFWFFLTILLAYLAADVGKILLAKKLRDKMTPSMVYKMKKVMGIILVVFGLALFSKGIIPEDKMPLKGVINKHSPL
jgi:threonine/homoserine/homoserine lactone efflux protein